MSRPTMIPRRQRRCDDNFLRLSSGELLHDQPFQVCFSEHFQHSRRALVIFHTIGV